MANEKVYIVRHNVSTGHTVGADVRESDFDPEVWERFTSLKAITPASPEEVEAIEEQQDKYDLTAEAYGVPVESLHYSSADETRATRVELARFFAAQLETLGKRIEELEEHQNVVTRSRDEYERNRQAIRDAIKQTRRQNASGEEKEGEPAAKQTRRSRRQEEQDQEPAPVVTLGEPAE